MGVHINEAGADDAAAHVNDPAGLDTIVTGADDGHCVARYADAAAIPGLPGAVDDASVAQEQVEHGGPPSCCKGVTPIAYHSDDAAWGLAASAPGLSVLLLLNIS